VEFRPIFAAIGRRWWILAIAVILGLLAGILATTLATPEYTATARLFVSATGGSSSTEAESGSKFAEERTESYVRMITTEQLTQRVVDQLALPMTAGEVSSEVTAAIVPRTVLFDVTVTDPSPDQAAAIANALADQFVVYAGALETPVGQNFPRVTISVFNRAQVPSAPSSPDSGQNAFYGVAGGIVLGLVAVALATTFSRRIRSAEDLAKVTGAPALGPINTPERGIRGKLADLGAWDAQELEELRRLRVEVEAHEPTPRVVLVTSASPGITATTFGIGLAVAFCETGAATALIVADPELDSRSFGTDFSDSAPALVDLLRGESSFDEVLRPTGRSNLFLVPTARRRARRAPVSPADIESLISSTVMSRFLDDLRREFDRVVIATASINTSSAAAVLSATVDANLLVVSAERARRTHVERAMGEFKAARANLLGAVLVKSGAQGSRWKWTSRPQRVDRSSSGQESNRMQVNLRLGNEDSVKESSKK
jgi:polysaccharide biosynthesis transport protein